jgi:hypothetical protein
MSNRKTKVETSTEAAIVGNTVLAAVKIKDLPQDTNLQGIKVKLPKHIYTSSSLPMYGIKNKPVYLQGWVMGDFFVKTDLKSSQIYPMFWSFIPSDFQEWEVVS